MLKRIWNFVITRKIIRKANKEGSSICRQTGIDKNTFFEGRNVTYKGSACPGCFVGYASYLGTLQNCRIHI